MSEHGGTAYWEDGPLVEPPGPAERKLRPAYKPELVLKMRVRLKLLYINNI